MKEIALHILDIAQNSLAAGASEIRISVEEDLIADRLRLCVEDNGKGMDAQTLQQVVDPFTTSRTTRSVGLGIPLLKAAAEASGGELRIESTPGCGTRLVVAFQHSHIDRMPLGDLPGTLLALVVPNPQVRWQFRYNVTLPGVGEAHSFTFDSDEIVRVLGDIPLSDPDVLAFLRAHLTEGIAALQAECK
jgi:anti-sigma regulatory factor (Ser/Thr protein kinase)